MLLVAGSANLDFVIRAPHIPQPGETVLGHDFATYPGGKGANQAVAAARAGGAVTHMLLALGSDAYAAPLKQSLQDAGVVLHTVRTPGVATGTAFITVSDDAENAITVAPGANAALHPEHLAQHLPDLRGYSHLLLQLEIPLTTVAAYARAAKTQGVHVVLNAAPAQTLPPELLRDVDILIVNQGELATLVGADGDVQTQLNRLPCPTVVVTLGNKGCVAHHQGQTIQQTAYPVTPVDTTGAGDTFCGVLVAALSQGESMQQALQRASAAAALACTKAGAQSSVPTRDEVENFLSKR